MHTIIRSHRSKLASPAFARPVAFRRPHYDCQEQADVLKLVVYLPGVDPAGVDLEVNGPDLVVTAPKARRVRANWRALHLEGVQHDYQLRLRLGFALDYAAMEADLQAGVLTVSIPKRAAMIPADAVA